MSLWYSIEIVMFTGTNFFRLLLLLLVGMIFFLPPIDTDLGWHLRYGNYLLETGEVLRENTLTYFLSDHVWQHSYTLYQLVTSLIYKWAGLIGLSCAYAGLGAVLFWIFGRINPKFPRINLLAFLGVSWMGWSVFNLGWRSQIFTVVGVVLTLYLLRRWEKCPRVILIFPPLLALWANLHGGFVLGLALLGFGVVQEVVRRNWRGASHIAGVAVASTAVGLLNPFGVGIYREAWHHAYYPLKNLIAEWVPPSILWMEVIIVVALAALIALLDSKSRRKVFWLLSLGLSTWLALSARRNLPLFAVVSSLAILDAVGGRLRSLEEHPTFTAVLRVGTVAGLLALLVFRLPMTLAIDRDFSRYCEAGTVAYPCGAVEYIRSHPPEGENGYFSLANAPLGGDEARKKKLAPPSAGEVYTAYEWGGFLEWQLPQYRYFVDGRMPTWPTSDGKSPYTIYLEIIQAQPGYQERLDSYDTDWLLIGAGTFLDLELQKGENPNWREVYRDDLAAVYLKCNANP